MHNPLDFVLEDSLVEMYIVDAETLQFLYANRIAQENLGYAMDELRHMTPAITSPHYTVESLREMLSPLRNDPQRKSMVMSNTHTRKDGSTYPVDVHAQFIEYQGRPAYFGYIWDSSEKQEALDQFRMAIKGAQLGYWDFNNATGEYFVDDHWLGMLGLVRGDLDLSNPDEWTNLIHPGDREMFMRTINAASLANQSFSLEFRMLHRDGHILWVQSNGSVVNWDPVSQTPIRVSGTHLDITRRKQVESEKEQFLKFFDISTDIMVIVDPLGAFLKVNPATSKILGYTEEELLSKPYLEFIHPEDRPGTSSAAEEHMAVGITQHFENRYRCKDGTVRWLSWTSTLDAAEGISYATARDITAQKTVEAQLREQEDIYHALVENSGDLIMLHDRAHRCVYVNPAIETLVGIKAEDILGRTSEEMGYPLPLRSMWEETIERVFLTGEQQFRVFDIESRGEMMSVDWHVFPGQRNRQGDVITVFTVSRDVTKHRRVEEELQKMQRLNSLGVLAGGIAHDFNNILTILFGNISMAKDQMAHRKESLESLENAEKAFHRASHLTSQLLTFAKGGDPIKQDISLASLVRETVNFDLSGSNVKLELVAAGDLWMAKADKGQIAQVFSNLTINADQAMPGGGRLAIDLGNARVEPDDVPGLPAGAYIVARVEDEGIGIKEADLDQIFDPYYSTKQAGSGLGLATVYSIIHKHGGHISVKSKPGKGTTFTLYLPASEQPGRHDIPEAEIDVHDGNGSRVLVMDDEEMICQLAVGILEKEGYAVDTARDGREAVKKYAAAHRAGKPYACVIMDLTIPGGLGGELAIREILNIDPDANAIVSSGYAVDPVMANFTDYGFKGVISKPFTMESLRQEVSKFLQ